MFSSYCQSTGDSDSRKKLFQKKKLEMLTYFKDSLERRTAAVNASIETLKQQIERETDLGSD
tara:strand:+ start:3532 stop:3717 length:186 start_codon:yes stop_codon:yes gene_type:complete